MMVAMGVLAGLCESCCHAHTVESRRGSRFWLCGLSRTDPRFPKYPRLPVVRCGGYEPDIHKASDAQRRGIVEVADRDINNLTEEN
jgi:hypothetical protein